MWVLANKIFAGGTVPPNSFVLIYIPVLIKIIFPRFGVGQNLFIYKQSLTLGTASWERAITDWYDEVELFSKEKVVCRVKNLV